MYRRLIFISVLLIVCITISIGSFYSVSKMSEELISGLNEFKICVQKKEESEAVRIIDNCIEKLGKYEKLYAVFLDHNLFENIIITIPSIKNLYVTGNTDEALDKCYESIETLKIIVKEQKLSFENIF